MRALPDRVKDGIDTEALRVAIKEIQRKVETLGTVERWCSNITESADKIRAQVASVMTEVSEIAERALASLVARGGRELADAA